MSTLLLNALKASSFAPLRLARNRFAGDWPSSRVVALIIGVHIAFWTALPWFTQPNLSLDTSEMLYWGREWQWGYFKHPPLPAWIAETAYQLGGRSTFLLYLVPPLGIGICMASVWRVARGFVSPQLALLAMFILESSYYFHFEAHDLNNNTIVRPFWALVVLGAYLAIFEGRWHGWLVSGVCLGLAMLAKYDAAVLALVLLIYSVADPRGRQAWKTSGPYVMLLSAVLVFLPHVIWLVQNDFPTISHLFHRGHVSKSWVGHLTAPATFLVSQLAAVLPPVGLAWLLIQPQWRMSPLDQQERAKRRFLLAMALGPAAFVVLVSAVLGMWLQPMWGGPLWTWAPLVVLASWKPSLRPERITQVWKYSLVLVVLFAIVDVTRDLGTPYYRHRGSRITFGGQALAQQVKTRWQRYSSEPLPIVAGNWWLAANVGAYSSDRPSVYCGCNSSLSPWLNDAAVQERGAVILSGDDPEEAEAFLQYLAQFPTAHVEEPIALPWRTGAAVKPAQIQVAIVPPAAKSR